MARTKYILLLMIAIMAGGQALAQQSGHLSKEARRYVRQGNKQFRSGDHEQATAKYQNAFALDSTSTLINYNMATAMFPVTWQDLTLNAKRDSTMMRLFLAAGNPDTEPNPERRAMAYHNLGVMHQVNALHHGKGTEQWNKEMENAIEAYKEALRDNPTDDHTRYNLVLCLRQMPKNNNDQGQSPPPPQDKDKNQNQNSEDQQQQQNQQQQDQQQQDQQQDQQQQDQQQDQQQQDQQQQDQQQQDQQQQDQQQQQNPDKDWMEQMINAAEQKERQTLRRLNDKKDKDQEQQGARAGQRRPLQKNW